MLHEQYAQLLLDAIRETLETMAFAEVVPFSMKIGEQELVGLEPSPSEDASSAVSDQLWNYPLDDLSESFNGPNFEELNVRLTEQVDFEKLINNQDDWCWACLKVNSPELESIWFIVSRKLAQDLGKMMYVGGELSLDDSVLQDIVAELTNVLGGRLMLLLEEIIGKFTLEVPATGMGQPNIPTNTLTKTVMCKVLVDGVHPVISQLCFREKESQDATVANMQAHAQ